jgi:outer membrane receptor protein involved in Fe transport
LGPSIYDSNNLLYQSRSSSLFGETYFDIIPDTLKLTTGLRWTTDDKSNLNQQVTLGCFWKIGTSAAGVSAVLKNACQYPTIFDPYAPNAYAPLYQKTQFDSLTGRAVLSWTPKLDFTDQTMVYASYAHGNRPGGFNPPSFIPGLIPNTFSRKIWTLTNWAPRTRC